jgi:uncharacterized protein (TIGR02217 family)
MMNFHEERFPAALSLGSLGGPERRTEIVTLNSGFEERNTPWEHSRRRYDAGVAMRSLDDMQAVIAFFEARRGQLFGFRWKDWTDYKSSAPSVEREFTDQVIAVGDGQTATFNLCKTYRSGAQEYCRLISKPVENSVLIGLAGDQQYEDMHLSLDYTSGQVTFFDPPPAGVRITAGFEFDVPVRFDTGRLEMSLASFSAGEIPNIPVVEVRI